MKQETVGLKLSMADVTLTLQVLIKRTTNLFKKREKKIQRKTGPILFVSLSHGNFIRLFHEKP